MFCMSDILLQALVCSLTLSVCCLVLRPRCAVGLFLHAASDSYIFFFISKWANMEARERKWAGETLRTSDEEACGSSSGPTCVSYWILHETRRRGAKRDLHFPGRRWKSILYNSLLPSRQIKGPLLKTWGKGWRVRGFKGQQRGAFITEPLIAPHLYEESRDFTVCDESV